MPEIRVHDVSKHYRVDAGVVVALDAVDAVLESGSLNALVGVSGSGKSTLLRLVAGLEAPSSGSIDVGGVAPTASPRDFRGHTAAYVAQRAADNVVPHLTLAEHVDGGAGSFELLGVAHRAHARAGELSGGELARAALAVALARRTPLVVVDEPTAELDAESAALVLSALRRAADSGTTVVVATHDPAVVEIADAVLHLHRGQAVPASDVAAAPPADGAGSVAVAAAGLTKSYGSSAVVRDVSLTLRQRELGVIVGRSGSGKSTLLMLLGGWLRPDGGTVTVAGGNRWSSLGFLPQRFGLVPELSVLENVALPARLAGEPFDGDGLLERLDLAELAERNVSELSIGQQQRVAVARALALRPEALIVDEPTSHQDSASAELVWGELAAAAARGSAVLVATHEADAIARAHRAWSIDAGRLTAR